jgi:hypothetical protein
MVAMHFLIGSNVERKMCLTLGHDASGNCKEPDSEALCIAFKY